MAEASNAWNALEGRRSRRNSKNYEDTDLRTAFEAIDKDCSGTIEENELEQAIREMDPTLSSITVKEMMNFADSDGDGKVTFDEYKKIMLYKPSKQYMKEQADKGTDAAAKLGTGATSTKAA